MKEKLVISLGGSLIYPDTIDISYLNKFKSIIIKSARNYQMLFIIVGGGKIAGEYQQAAAKVRPGVANFDLDLIGIECCRTNAELVRVAFGDYAYNKVMEAPQKKPSTLKKIMIYSGGWKPGGSSDWMSVLVAKKNSVKTIINLTNIDKVYDQDPKRFKQARPLDSVSWEDYLRIIGTKWKPRLNTPFDPTASKLAQKSGIKVLILNGKKIQNVSSLLTGNRFGGTVIG